MAEPRRKTVIYGNGAIAKLIWLGSPFIEQLSGDQIIEVILQPTPAMIEYYAHLNLKKRLKNYDGYEGIAMFYHVEDIELNMNNDPTLNSMFIRCGFNHEETTFTQNDTRSKTIEILRKVIEMKERRISSLESENRMILSRNKEWFKTELETIKLTNEVNEKLKPQEEEQNKKEDYNAR